MDGRIKICPNIQASIHSGLVLGAEAVFFLYDIEYQSVVYAEVLSDSIRRVLEGHSFESVVERNNSFRMLEIDERSMWAKSKHPYSC